jgi:hypothetical protein
LSTLARIERVVSGGASFKHVEELAFEPIERRPIHRSAGTAHVYAVFVIASPAGAPSRSHD